MDKSVVERGVDVSDTEDELALSNLGAERNGLLLLLRLSLLRRLHPEVCQAIHPNFADSTVYCMLHGMQAILKSTHHGVSRVEGLEKGGVGRWTRDEAEINETCALRYHGR